jgi:hypothetical protein
MQPAWKFIRLEEHRVVTGYLWLKRVTLARSYCHLWLWRRRVWISYWTRWLLTILDYSLWRYCQFLQSAVHLTLTESSKSAVIHQSSGTGFHRCTFPFLISRTIPVPQPQRPFTHSALDSWALLELPPLVTGLVPTIICSLSITSWTLLSFFAMPLSLSTDNYCQTCNASESESELH